MPFDRPTLAELVERIRADMKARLSIQGALTRRFFAGVLATVYAGATHLLHGHLEWAARQLFPATSDEDSLLIQAGFYGLSPTAATYATGVATATGTNGTDIPAGTVLVRDDGFRYTSDALVTIAGGTAAVAFTATLAGNDGNMEGSGELVLESPIAGVNTLLTVPGEVTGGNDQESTEAFRARFSQRLQEPPAGGTAADYVGWALEVAGVTRAWAYRHEDGLGTVVVRFVRDDDVPIFPSPGEVQAVQDKLDSERPITADVTAAAPTALTVAFTITIDPDTTANRNAVEAELDDLFARAAEPGDGLGRGTIKLSQILVAVGAAAVDDFTVTVPAADVVPGVGELPVVGTITWV